MAVLLNSLANRLVSMNCRFPRFIRVASRTIGFQVANNAAIVNQGADQVGGGPLKEVLR